MTDLTPAPQPAREALCVLRSGDAIANPVTRERFVVRTSVRESGGERFEVERFLPPEHAREPERRHPRQETTITVVRGVASFKLEGKVRMALTGQQLVAPAGAAHQLWNASADTLHVRFEQRPALESTERLLVAVCALAAAGETDSRGIPHLLHLAVMIPAYADTLRLTSPPWPVQRALCRLLGPLARARGRRPFDEEWTSVVGRGVAAEDTDSLTCT